MSGINDISVIDHGKCETIEGPEIKIGDWFWVPEDDDQKSDRWLGCVVYIGSNYVRIESPRNNGHTYTRVHFDELVKIEYEPDADTYIQGQVNHYQGKSMKLLAEIQRITARLGVDQTVKQVDGPKSDNALMVISSGTDVEDYKTSLIKAKTEQLPGLFKEMEQANESMVYWISAPAVPLLASSAGLNEHIKKIDERIFDVALYAGLVEDIVLCKDGLAAGAAEKLHAMQRRLYMDEECLLDYDTGGMEFDDISLFDEWLCRPHNMKRILPFPRTIVAMKVRRKKKERNLHSDVPLTSYVRFGLEKADETTFLYIRNGEKVYRLVCDGLDFGEMIFPDEDGYDPSEEMMFKMSISRVDKRMPKREYDSIIKERRERARLHEGWEKKNPNERPYLSPYYPDSFRENEWHKFDKSSVYYDDALNSFEKEFKRYNQIAILLQGLFDRSKSLHPHPPVKLWDPVSFAASIKLVYDNQALYPSEKAPDFEEYRKRCNESLCKGSMVIGQRRFWKMREADKENERQGNDYRIRNNTQYTFYEPEGNNGPSRIAEIEKWQPRARKAVFSWFRERTTYRWASDDSPIRCTLTVPEQELFNVDAYKPGDYKQFFHDPRTRENYMKWAPILLAAEEYHSKERN